ncbi:hypothetical protein [Microbacterium sp. NPDC058345]|uniref:hypothetical protein n=1 Tax=Microbacterium sp. NPDC058345 TaxID=3346455 RepID=UPI003664C218
MDHTQELVPAAHRALRRVGTTDSAFAGELVTDGDRVRVRVDAEAAIEALWVFADAEHVAGVRDVLRRVDGQDALLPWCSDRVDSFLGRRAAAERPLAPGEIVTLIGSLLRGIGEVADAAVHGRWWLTDDLRPLFVPGEGTTCLAASIGIVERVRATCADRAMERLLAEIAQTPEDSRAVIRHLERWERELTELAAPRALRREDLAPARVSTIPVHRALLPVAAQQAGAQRGTRRRGGDARREDQPRRGALRAAREAREPQIGGLARLVAAASAVLLRVRETVRAGMPRVAAVRRPGGGAGRGRMLFVGAGVAAVVLAGGLLWPGDGDDASSAQERPSPTAAAQRPVGEASPGAAASTAHPAEGEKPAEAPDPATGPASPPSTGGSPVTAEGAVAGLLAAIGTCAEEGEGTCAAAVVDGAGEAVLARIGDDVRDRAPSLVEDYGDVAVIRLSAGHTHGEQMLVLVRQKDRWLVRDVYDVADQPSGEG